MLRPRASESASTWQTGRTFDGKYQVWILVIQGLRRWSELHEAGAPRSALFLPIMIPSSASDHGYID